MFNKILEINHLLKKLPISDEEDLAAPETFRIHDTGKLSRYAYQEDTLLGNINAGQGT